MTDVGVARNVLADAFVFALLQKSQQPGLDSHWELPDFVQEQRASGGRGDLAHRVLICPSEGSFDMTEELALEKLSG